MCGIAGFASKTGSPARVGRTLLAMLNALECRGPDSAGVAIWSGGRPSWVARIKIGDGLGEAEASKRAQQVLGVAESLLPVRDIERSGDSVRLALDGEVDLDAFERAIEGVSDDVEVVSLGRSLEVVKQVGSPEKLDASFDVRGMKGTHGLGHTRLSTESRIDLSHSQPFWAHGLADVASVHNGHITNYHRLRRIYEGQGVRFYTGNDSEVIGIYLRDRLSQGDSFQEALERAQHDFDGSYCFLAATPDQFALVKDGFGFKPLIVAETSDWVAIATEEVALRAALGEGFETREPPARTVQIWPTMQAAHV